MKKIVFFPYHPDLELLVKVQRFDNIKVTGICSYQEDRMIIKPLNCLLGCENQREEDLIENCDSIVFLENYRNYKLDKYYYLLDKALRLKKEIFILEGLSEQLDLDQYSGKYRLLKKEPDFTESDIARLNTRNIKYMLETPVLAVTGMGKNCCKFETQVSLWNVLKEQGYHTVWISSNPLATFYGGYTMPSFLFSPVLSFEKKILQFNHFIFGLERKEHPDLFLIGIPEGVTGFETYEYNHFAEYPLIIGNAVSVDAAILCTYFMKVGNEAGIYNLTQFCRNRFDFPIEEIWVGRNFFEEDRPHRQISYSYLDENYLKKHFAQDVQTAIPIIPVWEKEIVYQAAGSMIQKLKKNVNAI